MENRDRKLKHSEGSLGSLSCEGGRGTRTGKRMRRQEDEDEEAARGKRERKDFQVYGTALEGLRDVRTPEVTGTAVCLQ